MDLIERAAQRLGQTGARVTLRSEENLRLVETSQSIARKPSQQNPDRGAEQNSQQAPQSLGQRRGRHPSKLVEIDTKNLGTSQEMRLPNGQRSQAAEAFRHIKRRVINYNVGVSDEPSNVLLITSAKPDEGKTHIAVNLAMSVALERDLTVVLVDTDLAKPDVTKRFGIREDSGLYDFLDDPLINVSDILLETNVDGLSVVPAGRMHEKSTELLASNRMTQFVEEIADDNPKRVVIFDGPPLLATTEAAVLTKYAGQILLVVESGSTSYSEIQLALDLVDDSPKMGFILNKFRPQIGAIDAGSYYNY